MKLAILDDYQRLALKSADWDRLRKRGLEVSVFHEAFESQEDAARKLAPFEILVLMRERTPFPRELIEKLGNLKFIALTGLRAASLDAQACSARRIPISTTAAGRTSAVTAELAFGLILAAARDFARAERNMRAGGWHEGLRGGTVLEGKRLGVIGLGKLGGRVAGYARAFGMEVVAWSQNLTSERAAEAGAAMLTKEDLLKTSDFVTIHLVLSDRTRGLLGAAELALMKPGAVLVNTSRGPIVDEKAMLEALRSGRLAHAALDVYDREPLPVKHPLRAMDNVTLLPHLGYVSEDVYATFWGQSIDNVEAWLDGKPLRVLNPGSADLSVAERPISRWAGIALLLVIAAIFGSNHISARIAFDHGTNVTTAVAFRSVGTALFVLVLLLLSGTPLKIGQKTFGQSIVIGLLIAVQSYCLYSAVALIPVALALLAFQTFPMLLSLISWVGGGERPTRRVLLAMPMALLGLALALDVYGKSGDIAGRWAEVGAGVLWALGASISFAMALYLITRWLGSMDGRLRSFLFMSVVAVVTLAAGTAANAFVLPADNTGWIALALLTVFYGVAITSTFVLLPKLGAVNNAAVLNFEPIAVLGLAWVILDQAVAPLQILGAFIVVGSIVWMGAGKR